MDIVVLAGGKCNPELRDATGAEFRADVPIGGKTLAQIVIGAVRPLGTPVLVGGPSIEGVRRVQGGDNFCDSLSNGLNQVQSESFLLVTVDLPSLTTTALQDFIDNSDPKAGLNYAVVEKAACEKAFPGMKRTTLKLREGEFTGGNVALMDTAMMRRAMPVMQRAYDQRKKPLNLAMIVGFGILARVVVGQAVPALLPLAALERGVGRFLGVPVHAVPSKFAEIAADLDSADQYKAFMALQNAAN
ncbi:MAG TPA: NTP transferase domain-containing protein [Fimbriimonadaceae bacterium]|nr:NTP transferase domain-containing protein [Fimbriimonadaceae bacterium]